MTAPDSAPTPAPAVILDRARARARAEELCRFIDASPMPYQGAAECARLLQEAGFEELRESDPWDLQPGQGYFVVRAGATVIAFRMGGRAPAETGISAVGAHLDSPNLRVKPHASTSALGYRQLAVDVYGGPILATWADRDLGLAGRVVIGKGGAGAQDRVESRLVDLRRPLARLTNVAIHLNRGVNTDGLKLDKQRHLPPILGLDSTAEGEEWALRGLLAAELGVKPGEILDFDLGLYDLLPACLGGLREEFLFAPRIDNLSSSHAGLVALIGAAKACPQPPETSWLLALYDHEEVGSRSLQGAMGTFVVEVIRRMALGHPAASDRPYQSVSRTLARSLLVSADAAHAVHPNYVELHEPGHHPQLNQGPAIKRNDNQRYATDGETGAVFAQLCNDAGFSPQYYSHRSDMPCGSTIGPISAAGVGIKTVDVGNPMLSMHSAREMAGAWDHDLLIEALLRLYR